MTQKRIIWWMSGEFANTYTGWDKERERERERAKQANPTAWADTPHPSSTTASPNESTRPSDYLTVPYSTATTQYAVSRNARVRSKAGGPTCSLNGCGRSDTMQQATIDTTTTGPDQLLAVVTVRARLWYTWLQTARVEGRISLA